MYITQAGVFVPYGLIILLVFRYLFFPNPLLCLLGMRVLPVYYASCILLVRNFLPSFFNDDGYFLGWLSGRLVRSVGESVPHAMMCSWPVLVFVEGTSTVGRMTPLVFGDGIM